jgi:hypothetical protein
VQIRKVRRVLRVVAGQEGEQPLGHGDRLAVILGDEVDVARVVRVAFHAAQLLRADLLAGDLLDHLGPGDVQLGLPGLDDEVGQRR